MKAVRIHDFGGPERLQLEEVPVPEPARGEILVRVHAASVNPVDYKIRSGGYPRVKKEQLPITLGRDISGVVEQTGEGTTKFADGDDVYAMLPPDRGGYAEYATLPAEVAARKPQRLRHVEAAAVPLAALTAWQGLFDHGGLSAGQRVLIHGAAGGVGHFAVQFARARGAHVFATCSGADRDFVRGLGAEEAIDYKAQHFEEIAKDMDMVFDLIGGETQDRSWAVLKPGGILVSTLGQPSSEKAAQAKARAVGYMAQPSGDQLAEIGQLIDNGAVKPAIDRIFTLHDASQAEQRLEYEHVRGKIVLKIAA